MFVRRTPRAFTVIELIVVVIILVLIAALAIPRFSRGATSISDTEMLRNQLAVLRSAIEMYYYDHSAYPAAAGSGRASAGSSSAFVQQLTLHSDGDGIVADQGSSRFSFGPYLRRGVPPCPVGAARGSASVAIISGTIRPTYQAQRSDAGWVYNFMTGEICANSNQPDPQGTPLDQY